MHPEDRAKMGEINASYDALLRKYGEIMTNMDNLERQVSVLEGTVVDHARKLDGLLNKVLSIRDRVEEINKGIK